MVATGMLVRRGGVALASGHRRLPSSPVARVQTEEEPVPAYVIVNVEVHDPVAYEPYRVAAPATIARYGGRYLARAGQTEVLEGDWTPKRLVVLEFESIDRVHAWLDSAEYGAIKHLRHRHATSTMVVIEGVAPGAIDYGSAG
jgi:uncharacterized protein (DUF1330 family)